MQPKLEMACNASALAITNQHILCTKLIEAQLTLVCLFVYFLFVCDAVYFVALLDDFE